VDENYFPFMENQIKVSETTEIRKQPTLMGYGIGFL